MKVSLAFLLALLCIAAAGDWIAPYRTDSVQIRVLADVSVMGSEGSQPAWPIRLAAASPQIIQVTHSQPKSIVAGHLQITAEGGPLFARMSGRYGPIPLGPAERFCQRSTGRNTWACRIPFRLSGDGSMEIKAADDTVVVHSARAIVVKADGASPIGVGQLFALFAALSAIGALFATFRTSTTVRLNLLSIVGGGWLVTSAGIGGAAVLVLILAIFALLRLQLSDVSSNRKLFVTVAVTVFSLIAARAWLATGMQSFANPGGLEIGVPLGFAFLAIRAIDVSLRISTREVRALPAADFARYMLFPATLAAGPIITLPQFLKSGISSVTLTDWTAGLARILIGISKKLLADLLLVRFSAPHALNLMSATDSLPAADLWWLLAATAVHVYLDFSGYSDMAIGLGRQLGFKVPENFSNPFARSTMRSFWQAWHITLSTWVARWVHVFIAFPLRSSPRFLQGSLPVLISLLVIGLWHELQFTWLLWGLHHAAGILIGDVAGFAWRRQAGDRGAVLGYMTRIAGTLWVWAWVSLSHTFTLISDPGIAAKAWLHAVTFGLA